jgi:hypothetical protein
MVVQGSQAKWFVKDGTGDVDFQTATVERWEFVSETMAKTATILDGNGTRGTRSPSVERLRDGTYSIAGTITVNPSPNFLELWFHRIMGAGSGGSFTLAETLDGAGIPFACLFDRGGSAFEYTDLKVARATFSGTSGGLIDLALDLVGKTELLDDESLPIAGEPAIPVDPEDAPYVFHEAALSVGSTATSRPINNFTLTIDNVITPFFRNSQTATDLMESDRIITVSADVEMDATNLSELYGIGATGYASGTLTFTNSAMSTTFTMAKLVPTDVSPTVPGSTSEVTIPLTLRAYKTSSTAELTVTNDATP